MTEELARREAPAVPLAPMNDGEMGALYRTAKALAESGLFKDATRAGQAFAKLLAGRDLGLTPFEAMASLHVIDGKVEAGANLHATRVRSREGYDYRVGWIKQASVIQGQPERPAVREAVWADEEDPLDLRETVGCVIAFTVDGEQRGVSRWTIEDSHRAGLIRDKGNHVRYPRHMYFARAMTSGVAWFVPEVMGGMRVYGLGEIPREPDLTASEPAGPMTDDLPVAVEAIIARAKTLGHAGLANREAWAVRVGGQPEAYVETCVRVATGELNRMAAGDPPFLAELLDKAGAAPDPPEAVVVEADGAHTGDLSASPAQTPERMGEADGATQAPATPPEAGGFAAPTEDEQPPHDPERIAALRRRGEELLGAADALDLGDPRRGEIMEEFELIDAQVQACNPDQGRIEF